MNRRDFPPLVALVRVVAIGFLLGPWTLDAYPDSPLRPAGLAKIGITPDYPIRLSGYGNRRAYAPTSLP